RVELTGIGAVLRARADGLEILQVVPEAGAADAGLVPGDEVVAIDGTPVSGLGYERAIAAIRGPEGSTVLLRIRRAGQQADRLAVRKLVRRGPGRIAVRATPPGGDAPPREQLRCRRGPRRRARPAAGPGGRGPRARKVGFFPLLRDARDQGTLATFTPGCTSRPPFQMDTSFRVFRMSSSGFAARTTKSARFPFSSVPRSCAPSILALPRVAATSAAIGVKPARTRSSSSRCSAQPGIRTGFAPESVPNAICTPASWSAFTFFMPFASAARIFGRFGSAFTFSRYSGVRNRSLTSGASAPAMKGSSSREGSSRKAKADSSTETVAT